MRAPNEILSAVVYIGYRSEINGKEETVLCGTGFFAAIPIPEEEGISHVYLVTAKHVPVMIGDKKICVRVNGKSGTSIDACDDGSVKWYYHPSDDSVDVAVMPWAPNPDLVDYLPLGIAMFLDDEKVKQNDVGIGDEVFISGLFTRLPGTGKNLPIVRMGTIAMMPDGRTVPTQAFGNIEAYLIEARSLGGISGSPVFVIKPTISRFFLLGLMHGHWDIPEGILNEQIQEDVNSNKGSVNMGIAIVVPAKKIAETLNQPALLEMRTKK